MTRCQIPGHRKRTGGKITAAGAGGGSVLCGSVIQWTDAPSAVHSPPLPRHTHTLTHTLFFFFLDRILLQEAGPAAASLLQGELRMGNQGFLLRGRKRDRMKECCDAVAVCAGWGSSALAQSI